MPYSYAETVATGDASARRLIVVPFPYISKEHVKVYLDDVLQPTTSYTWMGQSQIQLASAPAVGVTRKVQRVTPNSPLVSFASGGVLAATDLNIANTQTLYLSQETMDGVADGSGLVESALSFLEDVSQEAQDAADLADTRATAAETATATAAGHASTASSAAATAVTAKDAAVVAKDAAVVARGATETARDETLGYRNTASSAASTATAEKNAAVTARAGAEAAKGAAESASGTAQSAASAAAGHSSAASGHAATASSAASTAVTAKDAAVAAVAGIVAQDAVIKGQGTEISNRNLFDLGSPYGNNIPVGAWGANVANAPTTEHHSFVPFSAAGNPLYRAAFSWGWYGNGQPDRVKFVSNRGGTWGAWETLAFLSDLQKSKEYTGDLNNLRTGGVYHGGNGGLTNHPGDIGMWTIEVHTPDGTRWVHQRARHWWTSLTYERRLEDNTVWSAWNRVWSNEDNPAVRYDGEQSLSATQMAQARKNIGFVDAWSLGLRPDGADMSTTLNNILAFTNNVVVTVPGRYVFGSKIFVSGKSVGIVGAPGVEFFFNGATQGIEHTHTTNEQRTSVMDVTFTSTRTDATALRLKVDPSMIGPSGRTPDYGYVGGREQRKAYLRNVQFIGADVNSGWNVGAWLTSIMGPRLEFILAIGKTNVAAYGQWTGTAIRLDGRGMPTGASMYDCQVYSYDVAYQFPDYIEGVTMDNCMGVNCNYGIQAVWLSGVSQGTDQSYQWALGFFIAKVHFNVYDRALWMNNVVQSRFSDFNLYVYRRAGYSTFAAIEIGHGLDSMLQNVTVNGMDTYAEANGLHGIILHDCDDWVISNVNGYRVTEAVLITDGCDNIRVRDAYLNTGKQTVSISANSSNCSVDDISGRNLTSTVLGNASSSTTVGTTRSLPS